LIRNQARVPTITPTMTKKIIKKIISSDDPVSENTARASLILEPAAKKNKIKIPIKEIRRIPKSFAQREVSFR
jgi:hypothetical protein